VLNAAWSLLFFGLHLPGLALVEIVLLLPLLVVTTLSFFRVRVVAGLHHVDVVLVEVDAAD
jgi:tryptophan-rich sensory protein